MALLPHIRQASRKFPISTSWLQSSGAEMKIAIVSGRLLLLAAIDQLFGWRRHVVLMETCQDSALAQMTEHEPDVLITTPDLGPGESGFELVEQAHQLVHIQYSILIVDSAQHDLHLAFRSKAKAVISEQEIFAPEDSLAEMIRVLALGKSYRSPHLRAFMAARKQASIDDYTGDVFISPTLTRREKDVAVLLLEGCNEKQISFNLGMAYTTVRAHSRSLRRKFDVTHRSQLVLRLLDYGRDKLLNHYSGVVSLPLR